MIYLDESKTARHVTVSEVCFTKSAPLKTILGSCVSVVIFPESEKSIHSDHANPGSDSSMSHYLLPGSGIETGKENPQKYGNYLIEEQISGMLQNTAKKQKLKSMIFGGANLKNQFRTSLIADIGKKNIEIAEKILAYYKIEIIGRDVGGETARFIEFNPVIKKAFVRRLANNEIYVYSG